MIAKLITEGPTRDEALLRLEDALAETAVEGLTTNLPFLRWLVAHPAVRAGRTTTAFLSEYAPLSAPPIRLPSGPWDGAWRMNLPQPAPHAPPDVDELAHAAGGPSGVEQSALTAPMPGTVIKVLAAPGDRVEPRQTLLVLEAMKMETPVVSPYSAVVRAVHVAEGDRVALLRGGYGHGEADVRGPPEVVPGHLEELLELHRGAHVTLDLELAGHVRGRRVLLTRGDRAEGLLGRTDLDVRVSPALGHFDGAVGDVHLPDARAFDVEDIRVVHPGRLGRIDPGREGVEELAWLHRRASLHKRDR
jgi:hypothetical protein